MNEMQNQWQEYLNSLTEDRKTAMLKLSKVLEDNLPKGFSEEVSSNILHFVVPKSIFPDGYHCNPKNALPFISIANQKNFIAIYHMGIYADNELLTWFLERHIKELGKKPDMGKSCIRFKNVEKIPFELIGELAKKMDTTQWVNLYKSLIRK